MIFRPELAELVEKILAGETEAARILEPGYVPDVLAGLLDATIKTYLNLAVYEQDLRAEEERRASLRRCRRRVVGHDPPAPRDRDEAG